MKFAIYGFYFDRQFSFNRISFVPEERNLPFWENVNLINDKNQYVISGYINVPDANPDEFIFTMQTVLTFVQQQDVIIKLLSDKEIEKSYPSDSKRRGSAAPFVMYPDILEEIVEKLYLKLIDDNDLCNQKGNDSVFNLYNNCEFKSLVYKVTEPFHMRRTFIEITYFLYFSGLEAFSKQYLKSYYPELYSNNAPEAICRVLEKMEINYVNVFFDSSKYNLKSKQLDTNDFLKLSITTYTRLRNTLFHSNKFVAEAETSSLKVDNKYPKQEVKIIDFEYTLQRLCNVVILKYIGIENQRLDCSKWYTRFPLIKSLPKGEVSCPNLK